MSEEQEHTKVALIVIVAAIGSALGALLLAHHVVRETAEAVAEDAAAVAPETSKAE